MIMPYQMALFHPHAVGNAGENSRLPRCQGYIKSNLALNKKSPCPTPVLGAEHGGFSSN